MSVLSNFEPIQIEVKGDGVPPRVEHAQTRTDLQQQAQLLQAELLQRYRAGETVKALAAEFGLHHQTVRAMLVVAGTPIRVRQRLTPKQLEDIVRLYGAGHSTTEIGEQFEVYASTIQRALERLGVERRRSGRQS